MKKAYFIVISGHAVIDRFMKEMDLFNRKNLGVIRKITVEYDENANLSIERAAALMSPIKETMEEAGHLVSFVHLVKIRNGDDIRLNSVVKPYVDLGVRTVSDGRRFFALKDFIEAVTPFRCAVDKNFYIEEIL